VVIQSIDRKKVKHCSRPVRDEILVENAWSKNAVPLETECEDISDGLVLITLCPYGTRNMFLPFLPTFRP
jgi:hypothetical protein